MNATATDSNAITGRVFNFSAGPAAMPAPVLKQLQEELLCLPGAGASLMELSHRGQVFTDILHDAEGTIRALYGISDDYAVLFLQGGAALQFSMIPANLIRGNGKTAQYLVTGSWAKKALGEAKKEGNVEVIYDAKDSNYDHVPSPSDYKVREDAAYLYHCSNETIQGVQFGEEPACPAGVPLVCDASSDLLSRPLEINKYGILYACAQKNAGPAGVTVVIIRRDLLDHAPADLAGYMTYKNHADNDSMWNTPPTFAVWALGKVARWLADDIGGLEAMQKINEQKAKRLYDVIDSHREFYLGHAKAEYRSKMNVTFNLPSDELLGKFVKEAAANELASLKGHRSIGGIRASIYNAMPREGVEALASFMTDFASKNG
ncbi:3-phosphoserine/phosphohydroxythreonine transaminase [Novipirellula artificiosorum]|uniref:Phosphoserine aminotransferase n=1 Tax=Novipirellula artificiosorum TaxID=2528016 RepID=A0A5C6E147_9BACT|nr:3-phosphoserine/phosphohydroxythreonine transaminase [Novipirellula artificiosorum]TWU42194.1 Phosphoserine aminotransferase [Novipirellula artificiosorum]